MIKIVCDICGKESLDKRCFNASFQLAKTDEFGNYKQRYLHKDVCKKCAKTLLKYFKELTVAEEMVE